MKMEKKLDLILNELKTLNERITNIESNMATKENVAELPYIKRAVGDTSDTVKRIETIQEKHERTLDLLSRRSIDQEAELKRIE